MLFVSFVEWKYVTSTYYSGLSKFIPLSSYAWSIISDQLLWDELSSFISFKTVLSSLIQTLDYISILIGKVMSVFDELPFLNVR